MGGKKKKKAPKVQPKKAKRRVTAAERAKQKELGIAAGQKDAANRGANQRRERARRRQKARSKQKGCLDKLKRRFFAGNTEVSLNRRSGVVTGDAMLLQAEIRRLKLVFDMIDLDEQGNIDFDEFFEAVGEPRTPFTDIVFTLVDDPSSLIQVIDYETAAANAPEGKLPERVKGHISFDDYIQLVATYCLFNREDMLMFCFQAFDKDASGVIDEEEFIELCATVNNMNPTYPGNFMRAMTEFDKNDDGMIDFEEFQLLNRRYPSVLFPIFRLQDLLQKATLGEKKWLKVAARNKREKVAEKYKRLHNGQLPPMPFGEKVARKLCCCFVKEPVPGTWAEVRAAMAEKKAGGKKKNRKGRKKKGDNKVPKSPGGRAGASKKYH